MGCQSIDYQSTNHQPTNLYTHQSTDHHYTNHSQTTDLHTPLLQPPTNSPSALTRRLWESTRFLYYLLPRFLLQFTLLPLLHSHDKPCLQRFLARLPQALQAVSPPDTLLFALTHLLHSLSQCLVASSPLASPLSFLDAEKTLTQLLAGNLPLSAEAVANFACEVLGDWLQLPSLGVCRQRGQQTLLAFCFLVACVFPFAGAAAIAKTLLQVSLSGIDLMIMDVCVRCLSREFFSTHYREVIRFVSKSIQSPVVSLGEKTNPDSTCAKYSRFM